MTLQFERAFFDPAIALERWTKGRQRKPDPGQASARCYEANDEMVLAVNAAMATRRPLLVSGPPGSGKSSLGSFVAEVLGWRYYEHVITSRTQAQDLLWSFDTVRRLSDAQVKQKGALRSPSAYVEPGVLWWAFDRDTARRRGAGPGTKELAKDPALWGSVSDSVVLLDEIDKADPFVPNDLLVPLDRRWFDIPELRQRVSNPAEHQVLLIITTNGERELAPAFLRRCVQLQLKAPSEEQLVRIAELHHKKMDPEGLFASLARHLIQLRSEAASRKVREPSTAEFLDTIEACLRLGIRPGDSPEWKQLVTNLLQKRSTFMEE